MVYDTGHWQQGHLCVDAAEEIIGSDPVDLLIIRHSDGDHVADGDDILNRFRVRQILRTGFRREDTTGWKNLNNAVGDEAKLDATVINLQTTTLVPGTKLTIGSASLTLVFGLGQWTATTLGQSERRNAISIVVRLEYQGRSVLFTGDTVGRRIGAPSSACDDAEKMMVTRHNATGSDHVALASDVVIAPHHGADNASSSCFIAAVNPSFVIFPAGHAFQHPRKDAAQRYLDHGVAESNMFRTDRGDDEGPEEWSTGRISGCQDRKGDDDVEIVLAQDGSVAVEYRQPQSGC
jgi:competence protein ComEC